MHGFEFFQWLYSVRDRVVFLDTETTGKWDDPLAECCEVAVCNYWGHPIFETLVRTVRPVQESATAIHGILDSDLDAGMMTYDLYGELAAVLRDKILVIYNSEFDVKVLNQTLNDSGWLTAASVHCAMQAYVEYHGEYMPKYGKYKFKSLQFAFEQECDRQGYVLDMFGYRVHRAMGDAQRTAAVCRWVVDASDFGLGHVGQLLE